MGFYYLLNSSKDYQKIENEDKKDEEKRNHKEEMGIENERERTSSMKDCKHNVLHKPILLKMEKEIINQKLLQLPRNSFVQKVRHNPPKDKAKKREVGNEILDLC